MDKITAQAHKGLVALDALVNGLREGEQTSDASDEQIEALYQSLHAILEETEKQ